MKTYRKLYPIAALLLLLSCGKGKNEFEAAGTFEATEIVVSAEANGKLIRFEVEEGSQLKANREVGCIDTLQLYLTKMQLLASRKAVDSKQPDITKQIAALREQIVAAKREKKRVENLVKANAATTKQLDDADSQLAVLEKQLDAQFSTLRNNRTGITEESSALDIQIAQTEDLLRKCRISSPADGTVLNKYAEAGEIVANGKPLFKIADVQNMFLRAYITADQLTRMKLGQTVKVYADFGEKEQKEYEGTVTWVSDRAEFTPKTIQTKDERANLVYAIKISLKNDGYLKIGMYGEIRQ